MVKTFRIKIVENVLGLKRNQYTAVDRCKLLVTAVVSHCGIISHVIL